MAKRILVAKIASRGDLLLSGPTLIRLRERYPDARISLLVGRTCLDVAEHLPAVDEFHVVDDRLLFSGSRLRRLQGAFEMLLKIYRWRSAARSTQSDGVDPDEIVILHRDWRYGALARLARIPVRRGFATSRGSTFLTDAYEAAEREHHVSQYLGVAGVEDERTSEVSVPTLAGSWQFRGKERAEALSTSLQLGFDDQVHSVALGFGGGRNVKTKTALKCWPIEQWKELASRIEAGGMNVVWLGDGEDARALGETFPGLSLAGKLTVVETAGVLASCKAVVANDTLILHLGEALGVPTVALFGPTDPEHTRPLGLRSSTLWAGESLPCSPCHADGFFPVCTVDHMCMRQITIGQVLDALATIVAPTPLFNRSPLVPLSTSRA